MGGLPCANWKQKDGNTVCPNEGTKACSRCQLVAYCSKECQTAHWPIHKLDCNSPIRKPTWRPAWEAENRSPAFVGNASDVVSYGGKKYLWGNVPALDLLRLKDNEGLDTRRDFSILLAASGDLRNLVKTIGDLPSEYTGSIHVDINDRDETVVARSLILLHIAYGFPPEYASQIMLHVWYSAFWQEDMAKLIQENIFPAIARTQEEAAGNPNDVHTAMWSNEKSTLMASFSPAFWKRLLSYSPANCEISFSDAAVLRRSVTLAESRKDYCDRAMFRLPPSWRYSQLKFRKDGVLLPFGASADSYTVPNPTLFHDKKTWMMPDASDPLVGWNLDDVLCDSFKAKNDLYGQLHSHVKGMLVKFCQNIHALKISISLYQVDAEDLPDRIFQVTGEIPEYDRIEVANIADRAYLGPIKTIGLFGPHLKPLKENPKATLITLFLNASHEERTDADRMADMSRSVKSIKQFMPMSRESILNQNSPEFLNLINSQDLFADYDGPFDRFVRKTRLREAGEYLGIGMKQTNSIVEKWPMRLGKKPTQQEFERLFWSGHLGSERYVEWRRK